MTTRAQRMTAQRMTAQRMTAQRMTARRMTEWMAAAALVTTMLLGACVGDKATAPNLRVPSVTLGAIHVSPMNAIMAVGDTLQLHVAGQTLQGTSVTSFDSVEYILQNVTDSLRVHLSPTGLVTAVGASGTSQVLVEVIGFKDGLARADQSVIQITASSIPGATLSIQPLPGDSTRLEWGNRKTITPIIKNTTTNLSVSNPQIRLEYGPGDSTKMQCYGPTFVATQTLTAAQLSLTACSGNFGGVGLDQIYANTYEGTAWVYANVTVYGVPLRDSVLYTLGLPSVQSVSIAKTYGVGDLSYANGGNLYVAAGGTVIFFNRLPTTINASIGVTFDVPSAATVASPSSTYGGTSGNITPITTAQGNSARRFLTPGTYHWTVTISGSIAPFTGQTVSGVITVK